MTKSRPTLADVYAACKDIVGTAERTSLVLSKLAKDSAASLWLKLETAQPTGTFKIRGASNAIAKLSEAQRERGVVCCSTGNHGRALAHAARQLGVAATVCLSSLVPETKVSAIEKLGARVIRIGNSQDDAQREVDRLVDEKGLVEIPPFDHFDVIAGQGTIAVEILEEHPEVETLLVPLSGGGLISGIAIAAKAIKPSIRIVGLSMNRGAAMAASLDAGKPVDIEEVPSLADSLGGGIGLNNRYTFEICRDLVDETVLLNENEIYQGMRSLYFDDRLTAEGAAAVGHAAIVAGKVELNGPAVIIISGCNVDPEQFADVIADKPVRLGELTVTGD
jgi:threonine dehydratase